MTIADINTITVDLIDGDRVFRQGSTIRRRFLVKMNGVAVDLAQYSPQSATKGVRCQVRDAQNDVLAMTGACQVLSPTTAGIFECVFSSVITEAVTPEAGFMFTSELVNGRSWLVFNGVYDVELYDNTTPPELVECPVEGKIKMRRGVTR